LLPKNIKEIKIKVNNPNINLIQQTNPNIKIIEFTI